MKLNLYCGIRSIGWNINEGNQIVAYGVKRVNVDFDSYYAYVAGLPVQKRIDRRTKRSMRRNLWRFKTRREKLKKLLKIDGLLPENNMRFLDRDTLNYLREEAHIRKLEPQELGAVLLDIQSKRGYKSMRGVDDTGESEYLAEIAKHEENLKNYSSVGAYFRALGTTKNVILRRETYENEYREICGKQGIPQDRYFGAIFFQRPLKKGKIAFCKYERNRKVTHASNPVYQEFRIWRDVNNIELFDSNNELLDIEEYREQFFTLLMSGKDLTKAGALRIMGLKKPSNYKWYSGKSIAGNIFGKIPIDGKDISYHELWQDLISATDDEMLISILMRKYHLDETEAREIVGYDIRSLGYCDYSCKAINKLLPLLRSGKKLSEAVMDVYGKVDFGNELHLRNVVLEQVFFSAKSLVDALKEKYPIDEAAIEIDKLLKMGNKARKSAATEKRKEEKTNQELDARIAPYAETTEYNRKKLKLWDETGGYSPYFPDKKIPLSELFTEKYNLDHIIPKSLLFDFSNDNLVLCPSKINYEKNRQTGFDYVMANGNEKSYRDFVEKTKMSERKKSLLLMRYEDIPSDYISSHAGNDYNTRCFLTLHHNSYCIPNKIINLYRNQWKLNRYSESDVRNVLEKSFVMAEMDRSTIDYFDHLKEMLTDNHSAGVYTLQKELATPDLENMPVYCPKTKYFRRTKWGYVSRFSLHKESIYGQRKRIYRNGKGELKTEIFYKIRQPIGKLSPKMVKNISDKAIRQLIEQRIEQKGSHAEGIESIIEEPLFFNGKPIRSVSVNINGDSLIPIHSSADGVTGKFDNYERKVDFVYSSMNYNLRLQNNKRITKPLITALKELNEGTFNNNGLHKGDSVQYKGKQYIVCGIDETGIKLRSVYTLNAEVNERIAKVSEIEQIHHYQIGQTYVATKNH